MTSIPTTPKDRDDSSYDYDYDDDEDASERSVSASDFSGAPHTVPPVCYFGEEACRVLCVRRATGKTVLICGNLCASCTRTGHTKEVRADPANRGQAGHYETVTSKHKNAIDGDASTYMSDSAYAAHRADEKAQHFKALETVASLIQGGRSNYAPPEPPFLETILFEEARVPEIIAVEEDLDTKPRATVTPERARGLSESRLAESRLTESRLAESRLAESRREPAGNQVTWKNPPIETTPPVRYPVASKRGTPRFVTGTTARGRGHDAAQTEIHGAVTDLATLMATLTREMRQMQAAPATAMWGDGSGTGTGSEQGNSHSQPRGPEPSTLPTQWYAVGKGLPNLSDTVYATEGEARLAVGDVAGASYEVFTDKGQALEYLARCRQMAKLANPTPALDSAPGLPPDFVPVQHPIYSQARHDALHPNVHAYPPPLLSGADPSKREEDHVYGLDIGSARELEAGLCPAGLDPASVKTIVAGMVDVVALPGMSQAGGAVAKDSEATIIGAALEEIAGTRQLDTHGHRQDHQWRHANRTSLRQITTSELLRERINELARAQETVTRYLVRTTQSTLRDAGWLDNACIDAWAYGGFVSRIVQSGLNNYVSLHHHLMSQANSGMPWSYTQAEIDYHVRKLTSPRGLYPTRTQALCAIYTYLRDGAAANWYSANLQSTRNQELFTMLSRFGADGGTGTGGSAICRKCGTALHGGSSAECPWKALSEPAARQSGARALARLGESVAPEE
jgi:hypothetical protein